MRGESKPRRRILRWIALPVILLAVGVGAIQFEMLLLYGSHVYRIEDAPDAPVAIVLGASVSRDGRPCNPLTDRLDAAAELWRLGKVQRILVSGDRSAERQYDEVAVMKRVLREAGVPDDCIDVDPSGFRTFDTMWRARNVYDLDHALVVTNGFHVHRAVWLGRQFGLDVDGVAAPEGRRHGLSFRLNHDGREIAARVIAWLDVHLLGTKPEDPDRAKRG